MIKIDNLPNIFTKAMPVLQRLEDAGFEAYFVGGSVRDTLLGLPIHDIDIASSARPEEIQRIFKRTIDLGISNRATAIVRTNSKGSSSFSSASGVPSTRTRRLIGTLSGCAGKFASVLRKSAR